MTKHKSMIMMGKKKDLPLARDVFARHDPMKKESVPVVVKQVPAPTETEIQKVEAEVVEPVYRSYLK